MEHVWNKLPEELVEPGTITPFKIHLDGHMNRKGLEGYGPNAGKWNYVYLGYLVGMDELEGRVVQMDYGMAKENPINKVWFYCKNNPNQAFKIRKDQ
eukprot:g29948.t1